MNRTHPGKYIFILILFGSGFGSVLLKHRARRALFNSGSFPVQAVTTSTHAHVHASLTEIGNQEEGGREGGREGEIEREGERAQRPVPPVVRCIGRGRGLRPLQLPSVLLIGGR